MAINVKPANPSPASALSFGASQDRGFQRGSRAIGVIQSLRFAAVKLGFSQLLTCVDAPVVQAWLASGKWDKAASREAIPLPLSVVAKLLEEAVPQAAEDAWVLGCLLLMIWGGLRWSDAQRLEFSSLKIDEDMIRGWCWRTKTSNTGMPFGVLTAGITRAS